MKLYLNFVIQYQIVVNEKINFWTFEVLLNFQLESVRKMNQAATLVLGTWQGDGPAAESPAEYHV